MRLQNSTLASGVSGRQCIQRFRCAAFGNGHGSANPKRETIASSKRWQSAVGRAAVILVGCTFTKRFSEYRGGPTPAMQLGFTRGPLKIERVPERRLFPSRIAKPPCWQRYYRREITTRDLPRCRRHTLKLTP
jgi:hypothetical protein